MVSTIRQVIKLLDRPGGRWTLKAATRVLTGTRTRYDGRWMRVLDDGLVVVDSPRFTYYADTLTATPHKLEQIEAAARDYWFYSYTPARGDVILDIGAGSGIETRLFADAVGPGGRVYAIEAHPETYARLEMTIRQNGWRHVIPVFAAVIGEPSGTVYIEDRVQDLSNAISTQAGTSFPHAVPGISLDALCDRYNIGRIAFLKMNIEGAERLAIRGMSRCVHSISRACLACHDHRTARGESDFFATSSVVRTFFESHGFLIATRDTHPQTFVRGYVYASRTV
jgi:FkbM family methyltransferase